MLTFIIIILFQLIAGRAAQELQEKLAHLEERFQSWLPTFKAADPTMQKYCMDILTTLSGSSSQFAQDVFIYWNIFKYWPMNGRKGFYVDSGANEAKFLSNTYFFDKCLGWSGLCIEPNPAYHKELSETRSCTLVKDCISNVDQWVHMDMPIDGTLSSVQSTTTTAQEKNLNIHCEPLDKMLSRVQSNVSMYQIDFWSLDIEGYEMTVLKDINFQKIKIDVLLIEDFWINTRQLDRFMNGAGYVKFQQLPIDALYTSRDFTPITERGNALLWYPDSMDYFWKANEEFRAKSKDRLVC